MESNFRIIGRYVPKHFVDNKNVRSNPREEEVIDQAPTRKEAVRLLSEYKMSFGSNWELFIIAA